MSIGSRDIWPIPPKQNQLKYRKLDLEIYGNVLSTSNLVLEH